MSLGMESRLRRLERATTSSERRMFVFEGETKRRELIDSGIARQNDLFIFTGVQRSEHSYVLRGGSA
jgi:hypothetical protein